MSAKAGGVQKDSKMSTNPFVIPEDLDAHKFLETQKQQKAADKAADKALPVHLKTTTASRMSALVRTGYTRQEHRKQGIDAPVSSEPERNLARSITTALDASEINAARRHEKENLTDFVARKREIFLVQMSLDNKLAEIEKLEERAQQREEALDNNERMLQADADRFGTFLKENDAKVQAALQKAENEARLKNEKLAELKRLNATLVAIGSDITKYEDQLEECNKYRNFLIGVTPKEWIEAQVAARHQSNEEQQQQWKDACAAQQQRIVDARTALSAAQQQYDEARTQQQADKAQAAVLIAQQTLQEAEEAPQPVPPEPVPEFDMDDNMYFSSPQELLDMFSALEASNMFMLQHKQSTQEELEECKQRHSQIQAAMGAQVAMLQEQVLSLESMVEQQQRKLQRITHFEVPENGEGARGQEAASGAMSLPSAVSKAYEACGLVMEPGLSMLHMLTHIELQLEDSLSTVAVLPREVVEAGERARQAQRRSLAREEKLRQQQAENEGRIQKVLERAAAPPVRHRGKPNMARSLPPPKLPPKEKQQVEDQAANNSVEHFLRTPVLL